MSAFVLALLLSAPQDKPPAPVPGWHPDLDAGYREAERTGKPLLVVFR